jgi:hypothetical protein
MARAAPAKAQSSRQSDGKSDGRKGGGSLPWLLGVACGAAMAFATPSALLGGVLLAPAWLTAVFDAESKRPVTRVVFVSAAGFTFGPLWHLNMGGASTAQALDMLTDPAVLCPAWLAGACGWAVCEVLPLLLRLAAERHAAARMAALLEEARQIRETWDLDHLN